MRNDFHRRSIRLDGYDYTQAGVYFVTLVTQGRIARFGTIQNGQVALNTVGQMVLNEWQHLSARFRGLTLDAAVLMPDHFHGILILTQPRDEGHLTHPESSPLAQNTAPVENPKQPRVEPGSLGALVRAFKSSTTLRFHRMRDGGTTALWQRNYYERILRGAKDLEVVRAYIQANPAKWEHDQANGKRRIN